ncbi:hypothetical protein V6N13_138166 [Hibiscus sabdariffa]|uniref:non-specific serine/threonine protein kinase n=1 Tax=Hibiscus sabdariffa TaxID=183260 RepID=A0ABR2QCM6_9ROSI
MSALARGYSLKRIRRKPKNLKLNLGCLLIPFKSLLQSLLLPGQQLKFLDSPATSYASRDLIRGLLVKEPQHRLGVKRCGTEIKQHLFFEGVNWALIRCNIPPEVPRPMESMLPRMPEEFGSVKPVGVGNKQSKDSRNRHGILG